MSGRDDPEVRRRLMEAVDGYTTIYCKGRTPPDSLTWNGYSNDARFQAQSIVMTPNQTLSTGNSLERERPEDDDDHAVTIGAYGQPPRHRDLRQSRRGLQGRWQLRTHGVLWFCGF